MPDTDQPKIYVYLDRKFEGIHGRITEQGSKITELATKMEVYKEQSRPTPSCIGHIDDHKDDLTDKIDDCSNAMNKKIDSKVSRITFWSVIGLVFSAIGYGFHFIWELTKSTLN